MGSTETSLVLHNAQVITLDDDCPQARTIYIRHGHILMVNNEAIDRNMVRAKTEVIDCSGQTVIPGFHDAHCHIAAYADSLANIDFSPATTGSIDDIIAKIKDSSSSIPAGNWIRCSGYNEFYLAEKRHPSRHDLDRATTAHPVRLVHRSGHACVLNSLAMSRTGITNETEEPPGGMIERDLDTGEPNGVLYGMGAYLAGIIPPPDEKEMSAAVARVSRTLLSLGVTFVQDASPGNDLNRWKQFVNWKSKKLFQPGAALMFSPEELNRLPLEDKKNSLASGAIKIMLDEVSGSLNPSQHEINHLVENIHRRGLQAAVHAVEETTVNAALVAFQHALEKYPYPGHRHRIEHCSICTPANAGKLASLGTVVVTNPAFIYYSGDRYLDTVPESQFKNLYALNTMLKAGLIVAAGSDAPVTPLDPLKGIYAAVTRRSETGQEVLIQEAVSAKDALKLYTVNAAYSCFREKKSGTITAGKLADLVVLNANPLQISPLELKDIYADMTVLAGKVAYRRS